MHAACVRLQVFLDGQAALEEEERREEKAGKEFRRFNHRHVMQQLPQCAVGASKRLTTVRD